MIYTFIVLPLQVTFFVNEPSEVMSNSWLLDRFVDFIFFIDMILTFFTPVMDKYDLATSHSQIAKIYLQGWFFIDLVALLPFEDITELFIGSGDLNTLSFLVRLLKIFRLFRLVKLLRLFKSFDMKNTDNYIIKFMVWNLKDTPVIVVLPNFFLIVFAIHVYSCMYYFVGD